MAPGIAKSQKLMMAIQRAEALAAKVAIKLTTPQWETLIEAVLGEIKQLWATTAQEPNQSEPAKAHCFGGAGPR